MPNNQVYIITGKQGSGKTTFLKELIIVLKKNNIDIGGFEAEGEWRNNRRTGFILNAIKDGRQIELCSEDEKEGYIHIGRFWFNPEAIKLGSEIIRNDSLNSNILVIDEIGIFELKKKVWFESFMYLLANNSKPVIITVREKIVNEVVDKFGLQNITVFNLADKPLECSKTILQHMESNNVK